MRSTQQTFDNLPTRTPIRRPEHGKRVQRRDRIAAGQPLARNSR